MIGFEVTCYLLILLTLLGGGVYIASILAGDTRPHICSHAVWGVTTAIVAYGQCVRDFFSFGTWGYILCTLMYMVIVALAFSRGEHRIKDSDKAAFIIAFSVIPLWCMLSDDLDASALVTLINVLAFFPTLRKSISNPRQEPLLGWGFFALRYLIMLIGSTADSIPPPPFSGVMFLANVSLIAWLVIRCRQTDAPKLRRLKEVAKMQRIDFLNPKRRMEDH